MKRATPLITVDDVDAGVPFWTALGLETTAVVPHAGTTGFAMLEGGGVRIMLQSRASVQDDLGSSGAPDDLADELGRSTTALFVEVEDLDAALHAIGDAPVVVPRRTTFYGMEEVFVRAPCGTVVGLAMKVAESE